MKINCKEFHKKIENGAIIMDMRNKYESEVGRFENAIIPDVDCSDELLPTVKKLLRGHEEDTILMYSTGGIRCEKASAYLIYHGFKDISQLNGGIIKYANDKQIFNKRDLINVKLLYKFLPDKPYYMKRAITMERLVALPKSLMAELAWLWHLMVMIMLILDGFNPAQTINI